MVIEVNRALDLAFDGEVFAALQVTFDDDGFADVHHIWLASPFMMSWLDCIRGLRRLCIGELPNLWTGSGRCGWLPRRWFHGLITLPHISLLGSLGLSAKE
jgi:hypothetical protein